MGCVATGNGATGRSGTAGGIGASGGSGTASGSGTTAEELGETGHFAGPAATQRCERSHLLLLELSGRAVRVTDRREHEIGDGLRCLGRVCHINRRRADHQVHEFALAVDRGGDEATAGGTFHFGVRQFLLGIHELMLHLLRGGEQLLHVHLAALIQCGPTWLGQPCRAGPPAPGTQWPCSPAFGTLTCRFEPTASPAGQLPPRPGAAPWLAGAGCYGVAAAAAHGKLAVTGALGAIERPADTGLGRAKSQRPAFD